MLAVFVAHSLHVHPTCYHARVNIAASIPCQPVQGHKHSKKGAAGSEDGDEEQDHDCDDTCGAHGGHSLSSGAGGHRANPVAAMPGLVFEPKVAKSVVAFMAADTPAKVSNVSE